MSYLVRISHRDSSARFKTDIPRWVGLLTVLSVILLPVLVYGQSEAVTTSVQSGESAVGNELGHSQVEGAALAQVDHEENLGRVGADQSRIAEDQEKIEQRIEVLKEKLDSDAQGESDVPSDFFLEESSTPIFQRLLHVHGFFDLTFMKNFLERPNPGPGIFPGKSTFLMSNINLYVGAQMTPTLSATVELRFSFLPNGQERAYTFYLDGADVPFVEYERDSTYQIDSFTQQVFFAHSVTIERAQLTWTPRDWFKVIAGRYLTPYGIWNVEHGSTVILTAHMPYLQLRRMMPLEQTGLQVFGRVFANPEIYLDYSLTLSNGRADDIPTDAGDVNENKGLGGGLSLTYESLDVRLRVGGYGYFGKVTDRTISTYVDLDGATFRSEENIVEEYDELVLSGHILFEAYGLRIQGEVVINRGFFDVPGELWVHEKMIMTGDPIAEAYYADYFGWGLYGLVGYQLPLERWLGKVRVIPYFMLESNNMNDSKPHLKNRFVLGGINVRPSHWVALKLEYAYAMPEEDLMGGDVHLTSAQLAVSF